MKFKSSSSRLALYRIVKHMMCSNIVVLNTQGPNITVFFIGSISTINSKYAVCIYANLLYLLELLVGRYFSLVFSLNYPPIPLNKLIILYIELVLAPNPYC